MKKTTIFILTILGIITQTPIFGQKNRLPKDLYHIIEIKPNVKTLKIKTIIVRQYSFNNGIASDENIYTLERFDQKGNKIQELLIDKNRPRSGPDTISKNIKYYYNKQNRIIERFTLFNQTSDSTYGAWTYNSNGDITSECISLYYSDPEAKVPDVTYKYDYKNKTMTEIPNPNFVDRQSKIWKYDQNDSVILCKYKDGRIIKECYYDTKGNLVRSSNSPKEYRYKYNDIGKIIETIVFVAPDSINGIQEIIKYNYLNGTILTHLKTYNPEGKISRQIEYNEKGQPIEDISYENPIGKEYSRYSFKYDDKGCLIEKKQFSYGNLFQQWKYIYTFH